jgi:hypothetical protein
LYGCNHIVKYNNIWLWQLANMLIFGEIRKMNKSGKIFALTLLMSLLVLATLNVSVNAQSQATVTVVSSIGGTTDPAPGTTTYDDGITVTFTATAENGYIFVNWIFDTDAGSNVATDNPIDIPVTGGTTYNVQANFQPLLPAPPASNIPTNMATAAIVVVLGGAGGTTNPAPGTYALADASSLMLTATPDSGWTFSHWVIAGPHLSHGGYPYTATPTDNPYNVNHGYGNTYSYQPVFTPTGSTEPTPIGATPTPTGTIGGLSTETVIIIALVVIIIIILIAFGVFASKRKK